VPLCADPPPRAVRTIVNPPHATGSRIQVRPPAGTTMPSTFAFGQPNQMRTLRFMSQASPMMLDVMTKP
jgi:hypothetical protein